MRIEEYSARTVEDAISDGLQKMGIDKARATIEVLEQGGFLKKAKVRITDKGSEGERALKFVEGLLEKMGLKAALELSESEECATINIISVDSGAIIGHRGDVLDAIQYLASIVSNENGDEFKRIVVDCENYRERRVGTLETLAKRMADKAVQNGRQIKLEPMNAFERRIIHAFLSNDERVTTSSYGEEPYRYLTISPKNMRPRRQGGFNHGGKGGFNKDRQGGFNRDRDRNGNRDNRGGERSFDRPRKPSRDETIAKGFSSFGYFGNSNDNKKDEQ